MKNTEVPQLMSLKEFVKAFPHLVDINQMRNYIAHKEKNKASMWVRKIGRRLFVDVDQFFKWTKINIK